MPRSLLIPLLLCATFFAQSLETARAEPKTNVVFILTDNHGPWTLGCYGNPDIRTPHIDELATNGIRFDQAFSSNPVCSPTRATYLTGLLPSQHGVHNYLTRGRLQVGPEARSTLADFTSLPEILKDEGYRCGLVGKWHLGANNQPQEGLEDYWITMPHGGTHTFHNAEVIENGQTRTEPTYLTQLWTDRACDFIEENKEDPFFLYLAYNGPYGLSSYQLQSSGNRHADYYSDKSLDSFPRGAIHPWQYANREYFGNPVSIRRYAEEVSAIDDGVGAVIQKIQSSGLEGDTLIVFAADQGWAGGQHGLWGMGDHTQPENAFEYSMRIPLIFRHIPGKAQTAPNIPKGIVSDKLVSNYDFMPTVLNYLDLSEKLPAYPASPGRDYTALLKGQASENWDDTVFYEYESLRCIRTRSWKYIERYESGYDELYNLETDPDEVKNLIDDPLAANKRAELQDRLDRFFNQHASPKYDLWKGGASQTRFHAWGKSRSLTPPGTPERSGRLPSAIDPSINVPPMTLPDGLVAEVAAAPPLTRFPMMGNFDDRGRLFVAEAAGINRNATELDIEKPNFIRLLVDTNRDGLFDQSTVFADGLTFPSGALWHDGALWVTAAPTIWRMEDTDDDGIADKREAIVTGFGYTGNAADLHGPFLHPNGRIFWCHGRKDLEVFDKESNLIYRGKGARIWSCEADGTDVQIFAGGGMDNPVELVFTSEGEILGNINLMYGRPRGDTLVHWQYGGAYPRHDQETVLAEFTRTGDLLREFHNFGHVAVSGMTLYQAPNGLGDFAGNLFTTHFNTQKITRSFIEPAGPTFQHLREEIFLTITDPNAHLTDVMEDTNGDLLVFDTGGWFRNGCPVSQIAKPEFTGAIYRIRRAGPIDKKTDYPGREIDWSQASPQSMVALLNDERFAVRNRAIAELAKRGPKSLSALSQAVSQDSEETRRNAVWALTRIQSPDAKRLVRTALADKSASVRHTSLNSIWKTRDPSALDESKRLLLTDTHPEVQMAAARALGRIGDARAVTALLEFLSRPLDRAREHAAIYALIELDDYVATEESLYNATPEAQSRILWALNGMPHSTLKASQALALLKSDSELLLNSIVSICQLHPEWAGEIAAVFQQWWDNKIMTDYRQQAVDQLVPQLLSDERMRTFVSRFLDGDDTQYGLQLIARSSRNVNWNDRWTGPFTSALKSGSDTLMSAALEALAKVGTDQFDSLLREIGDNPRYSPLVRIKALSAIAQASEPMNAAAFSLTLSLLQPNSDSLRRLEAAQILSKAKLNLQQRREVVKLIKTAGPLELPLLVDIFNQARDSVTGIALVDALETSNALNVLSASELQRMLARFPPEVLDRAKPLINQMFGQAAQRTGRLTEMSQELETGDPLKGQGVFLSGKGACITCHKIGDTGREVGPDLSRIGQIRTKIDLLESILFPNSTLARDFEPYLIDTDDGQSHFGVIQKESSETLYLLDASAVAQPIARSSIKTVRPAPTSLMPSGLDQTMTQKELIDLIAYLDSLD